MRQADSNQSRDRARPLVFLHNWFTEPRADWDAQLGRFAREYDCLPFALIGHLPEHGRRPESDEQPVLDLNLTELARATADARQPLAICAHGIGCLIALRFAALYPGRVRALVLTSPVPGAPRTSLARFAARMPRPGLRAWLWSYDPVGDPERSALTRPGRLLRRLPRAWAALYLRTLQDAGETPYVRDIHTPTLLLVGERDSEALAFAERLNEALPASRLQRYGHLGRRPHREDPALFNEALADFLQADEGGRWSPRKLWDRFAGFFRRSSP